MAIKSFLSEGGFSVGSVGSTPVEVIDSSGNITAGTISGSNLTLSGNLTVNGSTTTINSTTLTSDDVILTLGGDTAPALDDNKDRGIEFRWHNGTQAKVGFFGFDDSTGKFIFIPDATNSSEVFSGTKGTIDANVDWSDVLNKPDPVITVTLTGDVTGTANTTLTDLGNGTVSIATTIAADSIALGTDTTGNYVASITNGSYITGGNGGSEGAALTLAVDATSSNVASKVVARDANGGFSAGTSIFSGPATTTAYALRVNKGNYNDVGGHTTFIGMACESSGWSKGAIGYTRTGSYDTGQLGFFINSGAADTNSAGTSDLRMSILGNGNVGIGLAFGTAPSTRLHLYTPTSDSTTGGRTTALDVLTLETENTAANEYNGFGQGIVFRGSTYNNSTQRTLGRIVHKINDDSVSTTRGTSIHFETSDNATNTNAPTQKMVIDYAGNVGIGTGSPASRLHVSGTSSTALTLTDDSLYTYAITNDNAVVSYTTDTGNAAASSAAHVFKRYTTELVRIDKDGRVGIGTAAPAGALDVVHGTTTPIYFRRENNDNQNIQFVQDAGGGWIKQGGTIAKPFNIGNFTVGDTSIYSNSIERIRILSGGNVGIGTISPGYSLHVYKAGEAAIALEATRKWGLVTNTSWANNGLSFYDLTADASRMFIGTNGRVGISNTSPAHTLDVSGAINTTDWFYNQTTNTGIFSTPHTMYLSANSVGHWNISSNQTFAGLRLYSGGHINTWRGHFYGDSDGQGFLDSTGNWALQVDGSKRLKVFSGVYNIDSNTIRITNPGGAVFTESPGVTGAFKIKLPTAGYNSNTMMVIVIDIYNYDTGKSLRFRVGGYNYQTGDWYNTFAEQTSDIQVGAYNVRFGSDGTSNCIWIGETNSSWSYPKVFVSQFMAGHSTFTSVWASGWAITRVTAFDTVLVTRAAAVTITNNNIANYGVSSITGTANQVVASANTGAVTLSLPQNIHTGATPTFAGGTLNGTLTIVKSNGGNANGSANAAIYLSQDESSIQGPGTNTVIRMGGNLVLGANSTWIAATAGTAALTINNSQNSTFAGNLTVSGGGVNSFTGTISVAGVGKAIDLVPSAAASPLYISFNQTVNSGGKLWRLGHTGAKAGYATFDIYNQTDNVTPFSTTSAGDTSILGNLTVSGTTSTFGGTAANNSITVSRITTGPSSVALQAFTNAPAISSTSDTASGYTWNRLISNGSEIVRVHDANLAAISAVAGSGISVSGGIIAATNITAGASSKINWTGRAQLESPSNGIVKISSDAGSYPGYLNVAGIQSWDGVIALSVGTGTGHLTANANLTVTGNLIVNGTTTTVDSTTLTTKDPIITLGGGSAGTAASSDDNKDRGIEFKWHNGTAAKTGFFGFDDSTGYFTFIPDATNTSEVFSGTQGDIQATNFRGALIGNASTATTAAAWTTARTITLGTDLSGSVSLDGSANVTLNATLVNSGVTVGTYPKVTVNAKGLVTAGSSLAASDIPASLFNNYGEVHGTRATFDATTPSYDFGFRYVQGNTNGPGTGGGQFYSWYIGLGSQYPSTGTGSYGAMFAVDRNTNPAYLSVRFNEANAFGTWQRIAAGKADTWTTGRTLTIGSTGKSVDGSANVSWSLAEIGAAATSHNHTSLTGVTSIAFAAEGSDSASLTTTISGTGTYFDFNLTDDNNNDWWRWRFTPSGSTVYDAMTLKPSANGVSDLVVAGTITGTRLISNVATGTAPLTVTSTTLVTNLNADLLDGLNSASTNTASTIVARDGSGNFNAGTITAALSGNATTATTWQTARNLSIGGTSKSVNGSADVTWSTSEIGINNGTLTLNVSGTGLSGSQTFSANQSTAATFTVTSNATSANTGGTIVARDGSGNFSAGTITANSITNVLYARNTVNNNLGNPSVDEKALFHGQFNNKLRFVAPYLQEQSTDGSTWTTSTRASSQQLLDMMIGEGTGTSFTAIPAPGTGNAGYYRLTWNVTTVGYCYLDAVYFYCSTNGNTVTFKVEARDNGNSTWSTIATGNANNWPGHVYIPHSTLPAGANNATAGYYDYVRVTFTITSAAAYGTGFQLYMAEWWGGYPASRRNVEWHDSAKNVWWPAKVYGTQFVDSESTGFYLDPGATSNLTGLTVTNTISGSINGNASTATTLQTARTIAGVSFNGSANITLTGQNISTGTGTAANDIEVAKYLRWKNYGNNHVLIDASAGTSPAGGAIDKYTAANTISNAGAGTSSWGEPISLMGWNGSATYGVRVDRARTIDNQANSATITATSANTASQIVQRDGSGNFSAGVITGTRLEATNSGTAQIYINSTTSGSKEIVFQNNGSTAGYVWASGSYVGIGGGSTTNSLFVSGGNVGIGTTSPSQKLEVNGIGLATTEFRAPVFKDSADTNYYIDPASTADTALRMRGGALFGPNTTWSKYLLIGGDGRQNYTNNVDTASVCTTNGNLHIDAASGLETYINWYDGGAFRIGAGDSATTRFIIDSAGDVGIGNFTTVSAKLEVATSNDTSGEPTAWDSKHVVIGAAGSSTSGGLFMSYDQTNNRAYIGALTPGTSWRNLILQPNSTNGNVGIGTKTPGYRLEVNGSFAATTKSFVIEHPTKEGKKLRYGSLEGPENGVYVRGRLKGSNTIDLPDYWEKLVDPDSITVNLTPVGKHQKLYVESVSYKHVVVEKDGLFSGEIDCFYTVFAERIDVEKLQVEIDA